MRPSRRYSSFNAWSRTAPSMPCTRYGRSLTYSSTRAGRESSCLRRSAPHSRVPAFRLARALDMTLAGLFAELERGSNGSG